MKYLAHPAIHEKPPSLAVTVYQEIPVVAKYSGRCRCDGTMRHGEAVMGHNTYERLPEIKVPTLVIHGEADRILPVENARILASRIPGAELVIFPNMGHMLIEAGDEPNRIILDFLRRHRRYG